MNAASAGFVRSIDTLRVGLLGVGLGVGRQALDSKIDPSAGFLFRKKVGDKVKKDDVIAEVQGSDEARVKDAALRLSGLIVIGGVAPRGHGMVIARL